MGEFCRFKAGGGNWVTSAGGIHRKRSKAAHRYRMAGRAPAAQLPLFEVASPRPTVTPLGNLFDLVAKCGGQ